MERMNLFQDNNKPQITFYFAECMEFPNYGEYKEFPSLAQAISLIEKCPSERLHTRKCVGFILHDNSDYDGAEWPIMTEQRVLKESHRPARLHLLRVVGRTGRWNLLVRTEKGIKEHLLERTCNGSLHEALQVDQR